MTLKNPALLKNRGGSSFLDYWSRKTKCCDGHTNSNFFKLRNINNTISFTTDFMSLGDRNGLPDCSFSDELIGMNTIIINGNLGLVR